MPRPTIKTIAQETGLSIATVSKALNDSPQVRPETRAIVVAAAARVGYQLNMHGVQLRTGTDGQGPDGWPATRERNPKRSAIG